MSGIYSESWLCSTIREDFSAYCSYDEDEGTSTTEEDESTAEAVSIEGVDLYGVKMCYYMVDSAPPDPLFGEKQIETVERAFWFMGYLEAMPQDVRSYQLQGIYGQDLVQVYVTRTAFKYFSTYGGSDRNTPETNEALTNPRIGDIVLINPTQLLYEIVDVQYWEAAFGQTSIYALLTMKPFRDTYMTISDNETIPESDIIRVHCSVPDDLAIKENEIE